MIIVIKVDGTASNHEDEFPATPTLEWMKEQVEGWIERVRVNTGRTQFDMIVNEEGRIQNLPENLIGSALYMLTALINTGIKTDTPITGNIIILTDEHILV
jgi:hypothetical protein